MSFKPKFQQKLDTTFNKFHEWNFEFQIMTLSFNKFHVCFKFKILKLLVSKTGTSNFKVEFQVSKLKLRVSASFIRVSAKFQKKLQVSIKFSSFFF